MPDLPGKHLKQKLNARGEIRTHELLRDQALNLAPLTWLGNPRSGLLYTMRCNQKYLAPPGPGLLRARGRELLPGETLRALDFAATRESILLSSPMNLRGSTRENAKRGRWVDLSKITSIVLAKYWACTCTPASRNCLRCVFMRPVPTIPHVG